tara:strand:- start:562 stop:888 length:327 start_codon:yes stop_codon:yes gene_type:complete
MGGCTSSLLTTSNTYNSTHGDLCADPLAHHRRALEGQACQPRRRDRPPRRQGLPPEEADGEAQGEEGLSLRQQGSRGLRRGQGYGGTGRLQGHCCQRQGLSQGPEAAR